MNNAVKHSYEFGPFRLEVERHRLWRESQLISLSPKAIDALLVLVQRPWQMVGRQELMKAVWTDAFVEDSNLTVAISQLRKALSEGADRTDYIETVPRVGYRFTADVREVREEPPPLIIEKQTLSQTVVEEELIESDTRPEGMTESVTVAQPATNVPRAFLTRYPAVLLIAVAAFCVLALSGALSFKRGTQKQVPAGGGVSSIRSIAVLPPKSLRGEADSLSLSLGMADALITRIGGIRRIAVRPTSAIVRYVGGTQDPIETGQALGVDAVLDGSMQREHGRVRVTLRLLQVADGTQLWSGSFEEADADIFKLQDSLSQQVAAALSLNVSDSEQALLTKRPTTNPEAYALYLQGNYFWNKRGLEGAKGFDYFRKAIELDPNFAQAYVGLAAMNSAVSIPNPEAEMLIGKALQLDDSLAEAHATYGLILMFHHWNWAGAEKELDRAIELNPNSATARHWKGVYLSLQGRFDDAKAEMHRALELDPLSMIILADLGQIHYFAQEYDQGMEYCKRALTLDADFWPAHEYLRDIYWLKGMEKEAFNESVILNISTEGKRRAQQAFAQGGMTAVLKDDISYPHPPIGLAKSYSRLGDKEHALYWLDRATSGQRVFPTAYINVDPIYEPLRDDPRFQDIVHRMGF